MVEIGQKKIFYCNKCNKPLIYLNKQKNYQYSQKPKSGFCRKCLAKYLYEKRGAFTHNNAKFWSNYEINILKKEYPFKTCKEISLILNRNISSIQHKSNRLGIYKDKEFLNNHPVLKNLLFTSKNNPMNNKEIRNKVSKIIKEKYKNGTQKLSGIALKSSLGLTKQENHPNWLGGISFEPYTKEFNEEFKKSILKRDGSCTLCNLSIEEMRLISTQICIHHINYDKKLSIPENCTVLCNSCHMKTNYNRNHWIKFFQSMLSERYGYNYSNGEEIILKYK